LIDAHPYAQVVGFETLSQPREWPLRVDEIPLWLLFIGTTLLVVGAIEVGYLLGKTSRRKSTDEKESPVSAIAGTVLALLAFILAFTFGIVSDRYDSRRELVRDQASAIRTAYSRSDMLPEPGRDASKDLYNEYIATLVKTASHGHLANNAGELSELRTIQGQLWDIAVANVRAGDTTDISANYEESLNDMANVLATRIAVSVQSRMPTGLWAVLYVLIVLGMIAVGYQTAIADSRRTWAMVVMALSFSIVISLIAALDDPERGDIPISQRPLTDLQSEMR
jgi:CDP-diglyceride synthetase